MAYTKLFSSIVTSTIWMEPDKVRIVWVTMLALADKNGEVQGSIPGLARVAGVDVEACRDAIKRFLSPDPDSRTKDDEGRRIEEIDGGWLLLNHQKYREMASKDESKEAEAKRKARYRAKIARNAEMSRNVPDKSQGVPENPHIADADSYADAEAIRTPNPAPVGSEESVENLFSAETGKPASLRASAIDTIYQAYPRKKQPAHARKAIEKALKLISRSGPLDGHDTAEAYLLDRTKAYAEAMRLKEKQYIPYPASWFNAESYNENPAEWNVGQAPAGSPVKAFVSPEPPGWRAIIDREFPASIYAGTTKPWDKFNADDREAITQAIRQYLPCPA